MDITEKKETENSTNINNDNNNNNAQTAADSASLENIDKEAEERQARDLKAGLHPLKVEGFWVCYCHLARPSSLPSPTDLHLFKEGIRPLWEDSANSNGGKWIIRFKKVVSGRFWEDLVLALVGDQLDYSDNVCGAVLSIRFNEDILSIWNRNASDHQAVMALRDSIKRHLKLPHSYVMEYKPHDASLRDNSSYRNTWLRG
ncbi:eukaryotic translation initiation factor NCBP isoform X2 [Hevea brasiliensis]|uniref:eukaryotic translation initiation factor NCBP isoform X2 n=1 Tax=Hevea brasiliensis TaxID=3981 RepID=UPI0025F03DEB|nr:eukaryotic translation initiation factor NCBP isoform X2 [Hevea brasiliensis]